MDAVENGGNSPEIGAEAPDLLPPEGGTPARGGWCAGVGFQGRRRGRSPGFSRKPAKAFRPGKLPENGFIDLRHRLNTFALDETYNHWALPGLAWVNSLASVNYAA